MFERPLILVQPKNSSVFSTISHNSMFFQTSPNWSLFSDSPWFTVLLLWPADLTQYPRCRLTSRLGLPAAFRDDALLTMFPRVHPIFNNNNINMYHFLDSYYCQGIVPKCRIYVMSFNLHNNTEMGIPIVFP